MGFLLLAALLVWPLAVSLPGSLLVAQSGPFWREPYRVAPFPAEVIEPPGGMPMDLTDAELMSLYPEPSLVAHVRMIGVRRYALDGVTLRVAIGPTPDGMVSLRLVPATQLRADLSEALLRSSGAYISFDRLVREPLPPPIVMRKGMRVVVTVEGVTSGTGEVMWTNPDATELLWDALGRPNGRRQ